MQNENSSTSNGYDFTKTKNYEEAENLLTYGYTEVLEDVKKGIKAQEKLNPKYFNNANRFYYENQVAGCIPNVPNAIRNLPQSMILPNKKTQKTKSMHIIYAMGGHCGNSSEEWLKAGTTLLTVIKILELQNISIKLSCGLFTGESRGSNNEYTCASVLIKDFQDPLDLQKICFPIAHPSMFRRFGFKWLETNPDITDSNWSWGYGYEYRESENIRDICKFDKNTCVIKFTELKNRNVEDLLKFIKDGKSD